MSRNDKIFRTETSAWRSDAMQVYFPTRAVYINKFTLLSACCFRKCPFSDLTCNKCDFSL